jgi:hypothetical protein
MTQSICIARIWNNGEGGRCPFKTKLGDFCGHHSKKTNKEVKCLDPNCKGYNTVHTYTWEHLGRFDEEIPNMFNKSVKKKKKKIETHMNVKQSENKEVKKKSNTSITNTSIMECNNNVRNEIHTESSFETKNIECIDGCYYNSITNKFYEDKHCRLEIC